MQVNENIQNSINNKEIFKILEDFPNYKISSKGRILSINNKKPISRNRPSSKQEIFLNGTIVGGRRKIILKNKKGEKVYTSFHRLVAYCFIPNPNNLPQVNHIDGKTLNNNVENLEWVSSRENCSHYRLSKNKNSKLYLKSYANQGR